MKTLAVLAVLLSLALVGTSCGFGGVVIGDIVTGPTVEETIRVDAPADAPAQVHIGMGGGELKLDVDDIDALVEGTVSYNVEEIKPSVQVDGPKVRIEQGDIEGKRIPIGNWGKVKNHWDLTLGTAPMTLVVNAGAAKTEMTGLAGLNAEQLEFNTGAGDYTLEFSGELGQDMRVTVDAGAAKIAILIPEGTAAELAFSGALTDIDTHGDWAKRGDRYIHEGSGPSISFTVRMGVGTLDLRNR